MNPAQAKWGNFESRKPKSEEDLLPLVYKELRQLANARMAQAPGGQTIQPTRLSDPRNQRPESRLMIPKNIWPVRWANGALVHENEIGIAGFAR